VGYLTSDEEGMICDANYSLLLLGVKPDGTVKLPIKVSIRNPDYRGPEDEENPPFILSPHSKEEIRDEDGGKAYFKQHDGAHTTVFPNGTLERNLPEYCCLPAGLLMKNPSESDRSSFIIKDLDPLFRLCFLSSAGLIGVGIDFHDRSGSHPINESGLVQVLQEKDLVSGMINEFGFSTIPTDLRLFHANIELFYHVPNDERGIFDYSKARIKDVRG